MGFALRLSRERERERKPSTMAAVPGNRAQCGRSQELDVPMKDI